MDFFPRVCIKAHVVDSYVRTYGVQIFVRTYGALLGEVTTYVRTYAHTYVLQNIEFTKQTNNHNKLCTHVSKIHNTAGGTAKTQ